VKECVPSGTPYIVSVVQPLVLLFAKPNDDVRVYESGGKTKSPLQESSVALHFTVTVLPATVAVGAGVVAQGGWKWYVFHPAAPLDAIAYTR
jgi:hypothetical protein